MPKVVLIYPSSFSNNPKADIETEQFPSVPNGLLSLATFVQTEGYEVKLIDARLYSKQEIARIIEREIQDALCVGVSAMTGQVSHGLQLSDLVKAKKSDVPIVWGGIHPILFPLQTCSDNSVDYVIQGEGEYAFSKLLSYLSGNRIPLEEIEGLAYKKEGKVFVNEPCSPLDVNMLPDPNYGLLEDIEQYINRELFHYKSRRRVRALDVHTSRGCPYRCSFCTNLLPCFKRWRAFETDRVLDLINRMVSKYNLDHIWFSDDFFFGSKKRAKYLIEAMARNDSKLSWEANVRADNFGPRYLDDDFLDLLKRSGCWALRMGIESGSQRVLDILKKDITPEHAIYAVRKCYEHNIIPLGFFMVGVPGEEREDIEKTISLILELHKVNPNAVLGAPGIFRPYPGTELYEKCKELGFKEPATLRQWAEYDFSDPSSNLFVKAEDLPWIDNPRLLEDLGHYVFWYLDYEANRDNSSYSLARRIFGRLAGFRLRRRFWFFRWEPVLAQWKARYQQIAG